MLIGHLEHVLVNVGAFVAGKADVAQLAGVASLQDRFHRTAGGEDALGIIHANDFVNLQQVQMISLQPLRSDSSNCFVAVVASRPSILVIKKAFWR